MFFVENNQAVGSMVCVLWDFDGFWKEPVEALDSCAPHRRAIFSSKRSEPRVTDQKEKLEKVAKRLDSR